MQDNLWLDTEDIHEDMDKPHDECGVFGIYRKNGTGVVGPTYHALYALQHRGQDSCGICVNTDGVMKKYRENGMVTEVFTRDMLEKITEGNVVSEVKFNIDYEGYIDEIQFNGGTASNQTGYIAEGKLYVKTEKGDVPFIDGFAESLLGAAVGDKVEVNVTFPQDYHNEEFAGKDATFYVTVNYICGEETVPEFTDDWVYDFTKGSYKTAEDFKNDLKEELVSSLKTLHSAEVWKRVMENATYIEIPEQQYLYYYNNYKSTIEYYASCFGVTYEAFLSEGYFGPNIKSDKELQEFATDIVKEELAFFAVMKAEKLEITDEEYEGFMADLVENSEYTREEIEKQYSKEDIVLEMLISETQEVIFEINTFTEKEESAE